MGCVGRYNSENFGCQACRLSRPKNSKYCERLTESLEVPKAERRPSTPTNQSRRIWDEYACTWIDI